MFQAGCGDRGRVVKRPDCLTRRALAPEFRDLHSWPTVDPSALPEARRAIFLRREQAIRQ
ncbi:MAG: hypothetical protein CBHOC_3275 [uncultured Caballeronia sp.]|nr:MAG: hypothetical protein CBHOC_3275 [uncultured Caballeronia sp.]